MTIDVPRLLALLDVRTEERSRGDLWAACPFPGHAEEEPSWHIDAETGLNHCFGCHRGGSAADFVAEVVEFSGYGAAVAWMREKGVFEEQRGIAGVVVVSRLPVRTSGGLDEPNGIDAGPLDDWPAPIRRYALRRGLTVAQAGRWGVAAGIVGRMRSRLWLPLRGRNGRLLNWTARAIDDRTPRYRNPSRDEGPDVAAVFGEAGWPDGPADHEVVVTEGELNALACERAGARFIAALGGSSLDPQQIAKVARFGRIKLMFDPDRAGEALQHALGPLSRWREVGRPDLPAGLDPCAIEEQHGLRALRDVVAA